MSHPSNKDDIDFRRLFSVIWAGRWYVIGIPAAASVIAVIVSLMLPNIYRSEALLAPRKMDSGSNLAALASQYAGLARLAGVSLPGGEADDTELAIAMLRSRGFVAEFIERRGILVPLMAASRWNAETELLEIDKDVYDTGSETWVRKASPPRGVVPSQQEAYEHFAQEVMSVSVNRDTGFITVAIEHYSPDLAKLWVDWLIDDINKTIMERDVGRAEQAISYLQDQIESTSLAELRTVFFNLIQEQTKTIMLAQASPDYVFQTIDPAVVPDLKARPFRSLIVLAAVFLSGLATLAGLLIADGVRRG